MNGIEFLIKQKGISKATCYTDNGTLYISDLAVILEEYHTHKQAGINLPVMQAEGSERPDYYSQFNLPKDVVHNLQRIALSDDEQAKEAGFVYRQIAQDILKDALGSGAAVGQRSVGTNAEAVAFSCVSSDSLIYNRPCKEWCGNPYCKSEAPSGGHL